MDARVTDAIAARGNMSDAVVFTPSPWLRNPHLQSVLASSSLRRLLSRRARHAVERGTVGHVLDCGDGVRLLGFHTAQHVARDALGLVVLLHGWEGSARSSYIVGAGARLLADGFDIFRLNLRDHGDTYQLNRELFHSARMDEVLDAARAAQALEPALPLLAVGFSLGGNFALRIGLQGPAAGVHPRLCVGISASINPGATPGRQCSAGCSAPTMSWAISVYPAPPYSRPATNRTGGNPHWRRPMPLRPESS